MRDVRDRYRRRLGPALALCSLAIVWTVVSATTAQSADAEGAAAETILERAGVARGVCAVVTGASQSSLPIHIAQSSGMIVHVRSNDAATVERMRTAAKEADLGIDRFVAELGDVDTLPYADNLVDLLIIPSWSNDDGGSPAQDEILRVLRPRGTAFVGGVDDEGLLRQWNRNSDGLEQVSLAGGNWAQFAKPPMAGAGSWSHWEHGPDNNPVSEDEVIKAPYLTQYLAHPSYIAMPSITTAAGGRTFLAIGHITHHEREWDTMFKLIASNGYNGTVLWERQLPEGYLVHRSAFIATDDAFYMIDGERALVLDPETGEELKEIRIPGMEGHWKWMVLKDGILYALAGDPDAPAEAVRGDRTFGGWKLALVWARTEDGIRGFLVETGQPGFEARDIKGKFSLRASITSELFLEDVEVPESSRLPDAEGLKAPLSCLTQARYGIAWGAIGSAMACYEEAVGYTRERLVQGGPLAGKQLTQEKLAFMLTEITKAQLLALRVAQLKDQGELHHSMVSMAKRNNVDVALQIARAARDLLGANGIVDDYQAMRHMMNLETVRTYEGTHDIHTLILGREITGLSAL